MRTFTYNYENYMVCTNVLHIKQLLYHWRHFFSVLELNGRSDSYSPKHEGRSRSDTTVSFWYNVLCIRKNKSITLGFFNSTALQTTPLLPRMLIFVSKVAKQLQPTSYRPVHTLLSITCAKYTSQLTQGTWYRVLLSYIPDIKQLL